MQDLRHGAGLHRVEELDPKQRSNARGNERVGCGQLDRERAFGFLFSEEQHARGRGFNVLSVAFDDEVVDVAEQVGVGQVRGQHQHGVVRHDDFRMHVPGTGGGLDDGDACPLPDRRGVGIALVGPHEGTHVDAAGPGQRGYTFDEVEQPGVVRAGVNPRDSNPQPPPHQRHRRVESCADRITGAVRFTDATDVGGQLRDAGFASPGSIESVDRADIIEVLC